MRDTLAALVERVETATEPDRELPPLPRGPAIENGALMPWRIVDLAIAKGEFRVSWRYRDETLRRRCGKLRRNGWLRRVPSKAGEDVYEPTSAALRARMESER